MPRKSRNIPTRGPKRNAPKRNVPKRNPPKQTTSKPSRTQPLRTSKPPSNVPFLPNEIILNIIEYLEPGHIGNFRLCCRAFSAIALPHLLRQVVVFLHHDSLGRLQELFRDPVLSQYVRSLHFEIDGLKEPAASFEEYVKEVKTLRLQAADSRYLSSFKDAMYNRTLTRNKLIEYYDIYRMTVEFQSQILGRDCLNLAVWLGAIQAFHNLDSLIISSGFYFRTDTFPKDPYRAYCINAHRHIGDFVGTEEFNFLLLFTGFAGRKLNTLRAGLLHWSAFADLNGPHLEKLLISLEHLTILSLVISTGEDEDSDDAGFEAEECAIALSKGGLARFIRGLPNLYSLSVSLDCHDEENFCFGADSEDILDANGYWPHLRELELSCIEVDPEHMIAFFEKHCGTLKDLCLSQISFPASLHLFFSKMRDILSLQTFHAFGNLWEINDDDDILIDKVWYLRWPEQKSLVRDALKAFLIDGGEYPLTWELVRELEAKDDPDIYELIKQGKWDGKVEPQKQGEGCETFRFCWSTIASDS